MTVTPTSLGRSPWQRSGAWALLLGAVCSFALPTRAAPSESASATVASPTDAPREVRLAALDPASFGVRLIPGATPQAEASRDSRPSAVGRIAGEVLGGLLGEALLLLPSAALGAELGNRLTDPASCAPIPRPRRDECIEYAYSDGTRQGLFLGIPAGLALGSALGVWLAGTIGQGGGNGWLALLGSFTAGLGTGLGFVLLPQELKPYALVAAFPLTLIGAIALYELSIPSPAAAPAAKPSPVRVIPSVAWVPGGGMVGLSGRF